MNPTPQIDLGFGVTKVFDDSLYFKNTIEEFFTEEFDQHFNS